MLSSSVKRVYFKILHEILILTIKVIPTGRKEGQIVVMCSKLTQDSVWAPSRVGDLCDLSEVVESPDLRPTC